LSKLVVDAPGLTEPAHIDLPDGSAMLVGRAPDAALAGTARPGTATGAPSTLTLSSPSVSANHVLVTREASRVSILDLGSRNGTWVRVPAHRAVELDGGADVSLHLAARQGRAQDESEPDEPRYSDRDDYADAVVAVVSRWLALRGLKARVGAAGVGGGGAAAGVARFVLASDRLLWIASDQTLDVSQTRLVESLRPWVARQNVAFLAEDETRAEGMILASPGIRAAHRAVVDAARRGIPNLVLLGPSGAGKERLARTFHRNTGRGGPFVAVNCSMFDRNLARADLFGADVGAYTGAVRTRLGAVERAHGGTLFLDEIADMPAEVQPLLLRFLDGGGEFERMGGDGRPRHADVRMVCATNKDLREASYQGTFRADLWWRLGVQVVEIPALRDRFDDVLAYLRTRQLGALSVVDALHPAALEVLRRHTWEGNFRELNNLVARLDPAAGRAEIGEAAIRQALGAGAFSPREAPRPLPPPPPDGSVGWSGIASAAAHAFAEDHGRESPSSWADVGTFVEQYLKPLAVQNMVDVLGADPAPPLREVSQRLQVDTKTITKHLRRSTERFGR
jgi:DNA-binding NtrC family response regulator